MKPRRSHTKSRSGCRECKRRKVKCDERLPSCFNCARRGMTCSLTPSQPSPQNIEPVRRDGIDNTVTNPSPDALSVAGIWTAPMPGASLDFQDHGLELMHHYSAITANTLALRLDMQHIWRMVLPEMSYNASFLSHGLLSVAALHKAHLLPARRDKYLDLAAYHQTRGMEGFRSIFSSIGEKNWHPAFCFSSTIVIYAFSPAGRTEDPMKDILQIFVLIRGIRSSLLGSGRNLTETPFSAWANGIWIVGENDVASYEADYEFASLQLRKSAILIAHAGSQAEIGMVMFFPYVISASVMSDIQANDPCALVLLSYFAVLLSLVEQQFCYSESAGVI
uniref:Zn(2)-C6 fungal-type domain-containing protein n=1 Tax=Fusarium oxysporum (strain Fo5176) TaxID=660025 RepID=A0A0D2XSR6_FUSOF